MFTLEFTTPRKNRNKEVARILRYFAKNIAENLDSDVYCGVYDANGNKIGRIVLNGD
jgi:hypothetical protein